MTQMATVVFVSGVHYEVKKKGNLLREDFFNPSVSPIGVYEQICGNSIRRDRGVARESFIGRFI
jgi:hypothetical protein